nr:hypothetical protein [Desulfobacterales bacterium]
MKTILSCCKDEKTKMFGLYSVKDRGQGVKPRISLLLPITFLLGITIAMFANVLFSTGGIVLSRAHADVFEQFAYWREFGFSHLKHGNLALWNPHIFSGTPFLGGFQSALLYPPNVLYLILPLSKAINFSIALHVFLIGIFMYLWSSHRGLHLLASLLSSVLLMFCGAYFMHVQAGHLPHLCTMTWAPLVFLSIDGLFEKRSLGWCITGMFAVTMQVLAGYPQHVFFTAIAGAIYCGFCVFTADKRTVIGLGFLSMYAGASALGAVQVLTGIQVAAESIRGRGLSFEFASRFSFPPENLITFLAPYFFGNGTDLPYWGRWYLWEMSIFVGMTGLILATYGCIYGERNARRFSLSMVVFLVLLALGAYTPLFGFLYTWIPGFDRFRGYSKFIFQASLFITMLAGIGLDNLIRRRDIRRRTILAILVFGLFVGTVGAYIRYSANSTDSAGLWQEIMHAVHSTHESYLPARYCANPQFIQEAGYFASNSLMTSAGTCLLLCLILFLSMFFQKMVYATALLAMLEIFIFGKVSLLTFDIESIRVPEIRRILSKHPGDYRILNLERPNSAMIIRMEDIWGYDSVVLRRYAEFMTFTQGYSPDEATQYVKFSRFHPLYRMLRCRFAFIPSGGKIGIIEEKNIMPHLQLIQDYIVIKDRNRILNMMEDASFDPCKKVILEAYPNPEPVISKEKGAATVVASSTDYLVIEADLPHPSILLITDVYSNGWRAKALPGSTQKRYDVMPANYILRAIPLSGGHHRIRVEYVPLTFQVGKWISIVAVILYMTLTGWYLLRTHRSVVKRSKNQIIM